MTSLSGAIDISATPPDEVRGITTPEGTSAVGVVQPLIEALVQDATVLIGERLGDIGIGTAVETDVRMDPVTLNGVILFVVSAVILDFCAELHKDNLLLYEV